MVEGSTLDGGVAELEMLASRRIAEEEPRLSGLSLPAPGRWSDTLRFLVKYAIQSGDGVLRSRLSELLGRMADSPLYDAEEGGFFEGDGDTRKTLSTNAAWMLAALRLHLVSGDRLCLGLARGILRFLHSRLRQTEGGFAAGQAPDPAYYRLSARERPLVPPPPLEPCRDGLSCFTAAQAFAKAGAALGEPAYVEIARRAAEAGEAEGNAEDSLRRAAERGSAYLALYHAELLDGDLAVVRAAADRAAGAALSREGTALERSRVARFLLAASIQLQEEKWEAAGRELVAGLLRSSEREGVPPEVLGNAWISVVYPPAVFTAVTNGSRSQKEEVLEALRSLRTPFASVLHRLPTAAESMQALPRLLVLCGGATRLLLPRE